MNYLSKKGFTLIELVVSIAVLAILALITIPNVLSAIEEAKISADKATLRTLNNVTTMYKIESSNLNEDVFLGISENQHRILRLMDNGYLSSEVTPQQNNAEFQWEIDDQIWRIYVDNVVVPLSPLGSNFSEISMGMIDKIIQKKNETGSYGRTWGDYRYTDLGLDPGDWQDPIAHLHYTPKGSDLLVSPEQGYEIHIKNIAGEVKTVYDTYNLIFDTKGEKWYYHSIKPENEVDINTLEITN